MKSICITVTEKLLSEVDRIIKTKGYGTRSEFFRELIREYLKKEK